MTSTAPTPVLVWIHGGALMGGGRGSMQPVLRDLLTQAGYTQISIDYLLAPETKLPGIIDDVQDAFRWVRKEARKQFNLNPDRLGVMGGSAGGYLTLMTGFCVQPRPRALVSFYGYGDIAGPWYREPDPFYCSKPMVPKEEAYASVGTAALAEVPPQNNRFRFYLYCRQHGLWPNEVLGKDPHTHPKAFDPYCPVRNVTQAYPPVLLLHGTADTDVPFQQSVDMAAALEKAGVPHELVTIPDGPHGFDGGVKPDELESAEQSPAARSLLKVLAFVTKYV
ncbi:MAG: alpha/beta hydrolase [Candidatus Hydrogenedentes bacterium]|nr:alpha/beta hydrolase [Candidatus Hydrogenedentota bacterium]